MSSLIKCVFALLSIVLLTLTTFLTDVNIKTGMGLTSKFISLHYMGLAIG